MCGCGCGGGWYAGFESPKCVPWSTDLLITGSSLPSTKIGMCRTLECCSACWGCSWWFWPLILKLWLGGALLSGGADIDLWFLSSASTRLGSAGLFCPRSTVFLNPYCGRCVDCSCSCGRGSSCSVCVAVVCCCAGGDCGGTCGCDCCSWCGCSWWGCSCVCSSRGPNLRFQCEGKCSLNSGGMSSKGNLSKPPKPSPKSAITKRFVRKPVENKIQV